MKTLGVLFFTCRAVLGSGGFLDKPSQDREISSGTVSGCESQGAVVSGNLDNNIVSGGRGEALSGSQ